MALADTILNGAPHSADNEFMRGKPGAAFAIALAFGFAACRGGRHVAVAAIPKASDAKAAFSAALVNTMTAKTARIAGSDKTTRGDGSTEGSAMTASIDIPAHRGEITMTMTGSPAPVRLIMDGTSMYENVPTSMLPLGSTTKPWLKISPGGNGNGSVPIAEQTDDPIRAFGPRAVLSGLDVSTTVRSLGKETLRGMATTHYQFVTSGDKEQGPLSSTSGASTDDPRLAGSVATVDAWVDGHTTIVQVIYSIRYPPAVSPATASDPTLADQTTSETVTVELSDLGAPVSIIPPPANQVADTGQLSDQLKGSLSQLFKTP